MAATGEGLIQGHAMHGFAGPSVTARRGLLRGCLCFCLSGKLLSLALAHTPTVSTDALQPPYRLPEQGTAVVLRWDSLGGMLPTPPQPALLVQANGAFSARPLPGHHQRRAGQLTPAALQALLGELLQTHDFMSLSGTDMLVQIEAISRQTGRLFKIMDGGITRITLDLPDARHSVELAALGAAFRLFPEVQAVRRLHAAQQRLLALAESAR